MSQVAIRENGQELSREKVELIKQTVAKGATDLELELFFHACKRTGLDPLMKQIYAIKRWNAQDQRETLTFQTGIDGYRLIADRTGCYAGSSDAEYVLREDGFPDVAKVTVAKLVNGVPCQFTASARWAEYCQKTKQGQPTSMWQKMPFLMLAKCAESLALRKAFPAELSGVYTHEEMQQADEEQVKPPLSPVQRYQQNKAKIATAFQELRQDIKVVVGQDGASMNNGGSVHGQPESVMPSKTSDAAPPSITDEHWLNFLDYMGDDPDRTNVGKQLKAVLKIGTVADLRGLGRSHFITEFQKSCQETGVPCSQWL